MQLNRGLSIISNFIAMRILKTVIYISKIIAFKTTQGSKSDILNQTRKLQTDTKWIIMQ